MITDNDIKKLKKVFATKDDLIQFKDEILGEIENLRADSAIDEGIHDQVEDHEIRIGKLEKQLNRTS